MAALILLRSGYFGLDLKYIYPLFNKLGSYFLIGLKSSLESLVLPSSSLELSDNVGGPREDLRTPKSSEFFLITAILSSRSFLRFLLFFMGISSSKNEIELKYSFKMRDRDSWPKTHLKTLSACWIENSGHLKQIQNFRSWSYFHYNCNKFQKHNIRNS